MGFKIAAFHIVVGVVVVVQLGFKSGASHVAVVVMMGFKSALFQVVAVVVKMRFKSDAFNFVVVVNLTKQK